jgi:hypothetical protein
LETFNICVGEAQVDAKSATEIGHINKPLAEKKKREGIPGQKTILLLLFLIFFLLSNL